MKFSEISIQCWNIYGIFTNINGFKYNKLHSPHFIEHTQHHKVFGLIETHHTADDADNLQILGYKCFQVCRKKKKFGRKHGGIAVYVHNTILNGVSKIPTNGSESILLQLKKDFFNFSKDLIVTFTYCAPQNSSYLQRTQLDPFEDFEQKISCLDSNADIICFGDYNARTGTRLDYIENEDNSNIPIPEDIYQTDFASTYPRGNMDSETNKYGEILLSLCKSVPLRICNGRKLGDIQGSYTCYKYNGQSTVDYCLASPSIFNKISTFTVNTFLPDLSDHCSVSIKLKTNFISNYGVQPNEYEFLPNPGKIRWDKNIELKFKNSLQSNESQIFLSNFVQNGIRPEQECIDTATNLFTEFLVNSAILASDCENRIKFSCPKKSQSRNWKFKKKISKAKHPKWHDKTCESLYKQIRLSSYLLQKNPRNPYIRGKIQKEKKAYKKLLKMKHKEYINNLFTELDTMQNTNPRGYMNLVKSLRDGSFDKQTVSDSEYVSPGNWQNHFKNLLGPAVSPTPQDEDMMSFVSQNCDKIESDLERPFTRSEFMECVATLKNNKSSSFDQVTNEMIKASRHYTAKPVLSLFNAILDTSLYPYPWRLDILSPLHKAGEKNDPNNFRGISVSSCFGKLFNKMLQKRLEKLCQKKSYLSATQGSGKQGSRTADHLMVIRCLFDKYVTHKGGKLFTCFVDLHKAFDTVPRVKLFYKLLTEYSIGGKYLKILQQMYQDSKVFIKLKNGLLQPFSTTIGVKQGCVFSPILFNLFIDKINNVFDASCAPVKLGDRDLSCLLWADDLVIFSRTAEGLQSAINKTQLFYESLGLRINIKKTKVLIFNKRGVTLNSQFNFCLGDKKLEITDQYQYLGLKLRPSGSMTFAVQELNTKASRAWFSVSKVLFKHKRMEVGKALQIFDSLVTPVSTYGCEFWLPHLMPAKSFKTCESLLSSWETFIPEKLNQQCCRMLLSVHRKTSRLAVLGELGRYPLFLKSLSHCLNYRHYLNLKVSTDTVLGSLMTEMTNMTDKDQDCWLLKVQKIEKMLNLPKISGLSKTSGKLITNGLNKKFDKLWLDNVNLVKVGRDMTNHNKLRTYSKVKLGFSREAYLNLVRNRNQRSWLSWLRTSSHNLGIELGRYSNIPINERFCNFCSKTPPTQITPSPKFIDDEEHFLMKCKTFTISRNCFFGKYSAIAPEFSKLNDEEKFSRLLCPKTALEVKLINKFIKILFDWREKIDNGFEIKNLGIFFTS